MSRLLNLAFALCALLPLGAMAQQLAAQRPVAVVESVVGKVKGVEFMDYVSSGQVIQLGAKDSIVLSYLKSCTRETITGGTVIVLDEQSLVQLGKVERSQVKCDSNHMSLNGRDAKESAGNVFRSGPREKPDAAATELLTLYGRSPMVEINSSRELLIFERLDKTDQKRLEIPITDGALVRGRFLDLAKTDIVLVAGASYAAIQGPARVMFKVAAEAKAGATPIIGRLLRFE